MHSSDVQRIIGFESRFVKAQASKVIDLPFGYAVLQEEFPLSHSHNRIAVTSPASAAELIATAEDVLGGAGLGHRYVSVDDHVLGDMGADLAADGYDQETISMMIYRGPVIDSASHDALRPAAEAVSFETVRPAIIRDWQVTLPGAKDEVFRQLADRTTLYERGADLVRLAVRDGGEIAARGDLYLDRQDSVAQFESLVTHPDFQGRGYGGALVQEALRRGQHAGKELFFLTADLNDWPIDWYRRLGFADVARAHEFTRSGKAERSRIAG